jgi:hypothetical protein
MQKINYKNLLISMVIINLIALGGFYFLYWKIQQKNNHIASIIGSLRVKNEKEVKYKLMERNLRELKTERALINKYFIKGGNQEGVVNFVEEVEKLGEKNNLEITIRSLVLTEKEGIRLDKKRIQKSSLDILRLTLQTNGNWDDSVNFLKTLELMPLQMEFSKAYLEKRSQIKDGEKKTVSHWQGTFEIKVLKLR